FTKISRDFASLKAAAKRHLPLVSAKHLTPESSALLCAPPTISRRAKSSFELHKIMQQKRSKRYRAAAEQVDRKKSYSLNDAVATLKKFPSTKFNQTVTMSLRLGVDPKQSDQMVRGTCALPHGSGKHVRVLVFAEGAAAKAAKDAGAEHVGFKDLI